MFRLFARLALVLACAAALVTAAPVTSGPAAASTGLHQHTNYRYGKRYHELMNAYWYPSSHRKPALLILHGGYWTGGTMWDWTGRAKWYAARGFQVFTVDYDLADTEAAWPAQRWDIQNAIKWIRRPAHADYFDIDPNRIVILGSSAGGHLATDIATHGCGSCQVEGVVALSGPNDPYLAYQDGRAAGATANERRLGDSALLLARCSPRPDNERCWDKWNDMAVKHHASDDDAPMLLVHFEDDLVPIQHAYDLRDAEAAHGVPVDVDLLPGTGHAAHALTIPSEQDRILTWLEAHA